MKCLLIYYSFTGQAQRAVEAAAREIERAGSLAVRCRIDFATASAGPRRPMSLGDIKRWTSAASRGDRMPILYDPPRALEELYDLVLVFSNTWQKSPATPVRSFLESAEAARLLAGRPFAVVIVCRRLWENNLAVVRSLGEAAGGRFVDSIAVTHNGGNVGSLLQTTTYMMRSGEGRRQLLGVPLPEYGLSPESLDRVAPFARAVLECIGREPPSAARQNAPASSPLDPHTARIVALEGGHNFRDIGGYQTRDARRIRMGRVYRSGTLADLTDADQERIARLGIKVVCDFRANRERSTRPSRWPASAVIDLWTRDHESSVGEILHALRAPDASASDIRRRMQETYRTLPYEQQDSFREVFRRISSGPLPVMFHCSAGKDRTGCAAALLLSMLDVPRETVIEDYLLSERFFESCCRLVRSDPSSARYRDVDLAIWEPMLRAERSYIETMFETLEERHGSVRAYLREVLGVDEDLEAAIRARLLE